jgi:hypothetical protein
MATTPLSCEWASFPAQVGSLAETAISVTGAVLPRRVIPARRRPCRQDDQGRSRPARRWRRWPPGCGRDSPSLLLFNRTNGRLTRPWHGGGGTARRTDSWSAPPAGRPGTPGRGCGRGRTRRPPPPAECRGSGPGSGHIGGRPIRCRRRVVGPDGRGDGWAAWAREHRRFLLWAWRTRWRVCAGPSAAGERRWDWSGSRSSW